MSSMQRVAPLVLLASTAAFGIAIGSPAAAQDGREWDLAKAQAMQSHDMAVHQSIDRWRQLSASDNFDFGS